jgi:RNA polymerase sigma-70 factor (ECF subfamily)
MQEETLQQIEFIKMLEQCYGSVARVCLYYYRYNSESYQDLIQDIVCTLWEEWPSFRKKSSVNTWVTRIALNVAADQYRRHSQMPTFVKLNEKVCNQIADETDNLIYQRLYDLIDRLDSEEDRQLLYLYLDKKSFREIALIMGISIENARQRFHRIKKKLIKLNQQEP